MAASANGLEPRQVRFKGAKQVVTAFAPILEAAWPEDRARLIDVMLRPSLTTASATAPDARNRGRGNEGRSRVPSDAATNCCKARAQSLEMVLVAVIVGDEAPVHVPDGGD